jgi:hypothetical protein
MKAHASKLRKLAERTLGAESESMEKYSAATRERIAQKAYELYEQRGRQNGRELDDWLEAEVFVRNEKHKSCE